MAIFLNSAELIELVKGRLDHNTTQKDLAREFGIPTSYLCDFLQGKRSARPDLLKALGFEEQPYFKRPRDGRS